MVDTATIPSERRQLTVLALASKVTRAAPFASLREPLAQLRDERRHFVVVGREFRSAGARPGGKSLHSPSAAGEQLVRSGKGVRAFGHFVSHARNYRAPSATQLNCMKTLQYVGFEFDGSISV